MIFKTVEKIKNKSGQIEIKNDKDGNVGVFYWKKKFFTEIKF